MPEPTEKLLTSAEAITKLGIGMTKFYELVGSGDLVVIRIPSRTGKRQEYRVEPSEIRAFIERNRTAASA